MSTASTKSKPVARRCPYCGTRVKPAGTGPQTCPACTLEFTLRDEPATQPEPEPDHQRPVLRDLPRPKPRRNPLRSPLLTGPVVPDAIGNTLLAVGIVALGASVFHPDHPLLGVSLGAPS